MVDLAEAMTVEQAVSALKTSNEPPVEEIASDQASNDETIEAHEDETSEVQDTDEGQEASSDHEDGEDVVVEDGSDEAADDTDYIERPDGSRITVDELLNGYERQGDYTRKTQALAEQRKELEAKSATYTNTLEQFQTHISQLDNLMVALQGEQDQNEIDMVALAEEDPASFVREMAKREAANKKLEAAKLQVEEARSVANQEQQKVFQQRLEAEALQLFEKVPEWKDDAVRQRQQADILNKAKEKYGLTDAELQITDHRHWLLLQDAVMGAAIKGKMPAVTNRVSKAPKVIRSKGAKTKTETSADEFQKGLKSLKGARGMDATRKAASLISQMKLV